MTETDPFAALHAQQSAAAPEKPARKPRKPRAAKGNGGETTAAPQNAFLFFSGLLEALSALPGDTRKEVVQALVKLCK